MRCRDLEGPKTQDLCLSHLTLIVAGQFSKSMGLSRPRCPRRSMLADDRRRQDHAATRPWVPYDGVRRWWADRRILVGRTRKLEHQEHAARPTWLVRRGEKGGAQLHGEALPGWTEARLHKTGLPRVPGLQFDQEPNRTRKEHGRPRAQKYTDREYGTRTLDRV